MKAKFINERLEETVEPMFKLIRLFPGMNEPVGTIFCKYEGWDDTLGTEDGHFDTEWDIEEYFVPFIGEFFEEL